MLLRTAKTSVPSVRHAVAHERLFARLDGALASRAVWVCGPPGAGKTTLLASYVAARGLDCVWYRVDAGDLDLASFFHDLALATHRSGSRQSRLPRFTPEYLGGEAAFARRFFRELFAGRGRSSLLVLDDVPGAESSRLHLVLSQGLEELTDGIRLVLVSREDPLPPFARLVAHRMLERIGGEELLLSPDEALAVARAHAAPDRAVADLRRACERAAGWTAGIVLLVTGPVLREEHVMPPRSLFDYLAGEIFDRAPREERRVLLAAALLPVAPVHLADALCESAEAERILGALAQRAYFTVRREGPWPVFELHPLLREFLLSRAGSARSPDDLRRFRARAAMILEEAGYSESALDLLLAAEDWVRAIRIVLAIAPKLVEIGRTRTLEGWLTAIPEEMRSRNPWLSYWLGVCRVPFDPFGARAHLARAYADFEAAGDVDGACLAWSGIIDAILRRFADFREMGGWLERFEQFRSRHPGAIATDVERRVAVSMFAAMLWHRPHSSTLTALEQGAFDLALDGSAPLSVRVLMAHWLVVWCAMRGENARARPVVATIAPLVDSNAVDPLTAISWLAAEAVHAWHVGAASRAAQVVERGAALARETGVHVWDVPLHLQGVNAALADDDLGRARAALRAAEALLDRDNLLALSIFEHERGLVALRAGQRDEAVESAHSVLRLGARGGMPFHEALGEIMLALTFVAAGESGAARPHLEAARRLGIAMRSEYVAVVCDLCEAELSRREGDLPAARERLACALRTSREKHIAPDVWFSRKQLGDLCTVALDAAIEVAHVRGWVERLRLEPTSLAHTLEEWPWGVRIRVLGKLEVIVGREPLAYGQRGRWRPLDVIAALVASGHAEAPEHAIAGVLWPESEGDRSQHALETAVYRLRRLLGAGVVVHRNRTVGIDTRTTWVDVLSLHTLLEQGDACLARGDLDAALSLADRAVGLYRGPFLADREDSWVLAARRRVRMKVERAVRDLVRRGAPRERVRALQTRIASAAPESELDARDADTGNVRA